MGADTKANASGMAAHLRLVIFVSLRMAASAVTPSSLMLLFKRLRAKTEEQDGNGEKVGVSTGADKNASTRGGGALERSHSAPLEPLAQLGDAVSGVLAVTIIADATEAVRRQAAEGGQGQCQSNGH